MTATEKTSENCQLPGLLWSQFLVILFICFMPVGADSADVDSIVNQIKQEQASPQTQQAAVVQVPSSVSTAPSSVRINPNPPPVTTAAPQGQAKPARLIPPQVWAPKDKLPKKVDGHGVAGRFAVEGHYEGRLCLVPLEDRANPFARHFVVVNRSLNLPEFHVLPIPERETIEIPRDAPLIIERKGIMGYYYVRVQD